MCVKRISGGGGQGRNPDEAIPGVHYFGRTSSAKTSTRSLFTLFEDAAARARDLPKAAPCRKRLEDAIEEAWRLRTTNEPVARRILQDALDGASARRVLPKANARRPVHMS